MFDCRDSDEQKLSIDSHFFLKEEQIYVKSTRSCWKMDRSGPNVHKNMVFAPCSDSSDQKFFYEASSKTIKTLASGLTSGDDYSDHCLDWWPQDTARNVKMYPCHDGKHQKWWIDSRNRFRTYVDWDMCLGRDSNNNMKMFDCRDSDEQTMLIHPDFPPDPIDVSYGSRMKINGKCVHVEADNNVVVDGCIDNEEAQYFFFDKARNDREGSICARIGGSTKCLREDGTNIIAFEARYGFWMDSKNRFRNELENCIGRNSDTNKLQLFDCRNSDNQKFEVSSSFYPDDMVGHIQDASNGLCIGVMYYPDHSSPIAEIVDCDWDDYNQIWSRTDDGKVENIGYELCMDVTNGSVQDPNWWQVKLKLCNSYKTQQIKRVDGSLLQIVSGDIQYSVKDMDGEKRGYATHGNGDALIFPKKSFD